MAALWQLDTGPSGHGIEGQRAVAVHAVARADPGSQASDRRRALEVGFDAQLTKPVDVREIEALISR